MKYAHGFVVLCFILVVSSRFCGFVLFIYIYSSELLHWHTIDCPSACEVIVKDMGKTAKYPTKPKHNKVWELCTYFFRYIVHKVSLFCVALATNFNTLFLIGFGEWYHMQLHIYFTAKHSIVEYLIFAGIQWRPHWLSQAADSPYSISWSFLCEIRLVSHFKALAYKHCS